MVRAALHHGGKALQHVGKVQHRDAGAQTRVQLLAMHVVPGGLKGFECGQGARGVVVAGPARGHVGAGGRQQRRTSAQGANNEGQEEAQQFRAGWGHVGAPSRPAWAWRLDPL